MWMQELDDIALLREYVDHDSAEAFATLVTRHVNKVYSVALRHTRNPHQAEEITQAVFVILAKKSRHLGRGVVLSGWLYQTARLAALTFIRSEIRRARREQEAQMQTLLNETESEVWTQIGPLLDAAMAGLNEKDRYAVVLRFFDGKSMREVGAALGGSEDAAKTRVNRAVEKLRQFFVKRGIASTTESIAGAIAVNSVQAAPAALAHTAMVLAFAKGATASGSTLTLIKGALKVMAWTKAKTAIITGAAIVLATGTTPLLVEAVRSAHADVSPDIQGAWETGGFWVVSPLALARTFEIHTVLKVSKTNGAYRATLDIPELGQRDYPVAKFEYKNGTMRLQLNRLVRCEGTVDPTGTEIHSLFFLRNGRKTKTDVLWKRTTQPDVPAPPLAERDYVPAEHSTLQGFWEGYASIRGIPLRMNLKISEPSEGVFRAEMDDLYCGIMHIPVTVTYDKTNVELTHLRIKLKGTLDNSNTEIRGTLPNGSSVIPWTFKRGNQEQRGDFSYANEMDLQGHWRGMLDGEGIKLQLFLHIAKLTDGKYSATLDSSDGTSGMLATVVRYRPPEVRIEWVCSGCSFEGKLEHGKLSGVWNDGGEPTRLVFERSDLK
jgi:RNA polymerase sigma factor (sigma-70 family)